MRRSNLVFLLLALFVAQVQAATYYVDYVGGADANNGTATGTPWQHHPWDSRATNSADITLAASDTVILKGGVVYQLTADSDELLASSSGTSGNLIVLDGDSGSYVSRWGSGTDKAIIDGNDAALDHIDLSDRDYITVNNFELRNAGYGGGFGLGGAFVRLGDVNNIVISNGYFHERYDWDLESGADKVGSYMLAIGSGVLITGTSDSITIDNIEMTRCGSVFVSIGDSASNVEVKNCDLHDYAVWFMAVGTDGATEEQSNILIHDNTLRNMYHYSASFWSGDLTDDKQNYSTEDNPHQDGLFIRQPSGTGAIENLQFYNNNLHNDITAIEPGGTAWIFTSQLNPGTSVYIFNNTFQNPYPYPAVSLGWNQEDGYSISVYHNTFSSGGNSVKMTEYLASTTHTIAVKNNIFAGSTALVPAATAPGTCESLYSMLDSDYNMFSSDETYITYGGCLYNGTLASWRSASGSDSNSVHAAPGFVSAQTGSLSPTSDLRLTVTSDAIGMALVLDETNFPGAETDADGNTRGSTGEACDAGAYEFVALLQGRNHYPFKP